MNRIIQTTQTFLQRYIKINYLESTEIQWIDTGIKALKNNNITFNCGIKDINNNTGGAYFYFFGASQGIRLYSHLGTLFKNSGSSIGFGYYNWSSIGISSTSDYQEITYTFREGYQQITINENTKTTNFETVIDEFPDLNYYLFAYDAPEGSLYDTPWSAARCKFYFAKIYKDDKLVRNFIPVLRNYDMKPGMLDMVEKKFYTNVGTGEFLYG